MKAFVLRYIKSWVIEEVEKRVFVPLDKKASDSESKWDDELVREIRQAFYDWIENV